MKDERKNRTLEDNFTTRAALVFDILLTIVLILAYPLVAYNPIRYVFLAVIIVSLFLIVYYFMKRRRK